MAQSSNVSEKIRRLEEENKRLKAEVERLGMLNDEMKTENNILIVAIKKLKIESTFLNIKSLRLKHLKRFNDHSEISSLDGERSSKILLWEFKERPGD